MINDIYFKISQFNTSSLFELNYLYYLTIFIYFACGLIIISLFIKILKFIIALRKQLKEPFIFLELTPPSNSKQSAFSTDQLFNLIHSLGSQRSIFEKLLGIFHHYSFELVSSKKQGIRYILRVPQKDVSILKRGLLSYLPELKIKNLSEYLSVNSAKIHTQARDFKLSNHFAYPLKKYDDLAKHDPIAYITGMMTKLTGNELISIQLILTPKKNRLAKKIAQQIFYNADVLQYIHSSSSSIVVKILLKLLLYILWLGFVVCMIPFWLIGNLMTNGNTDFPVFPADMKSNLDKTPVEQDVISAIRSKVDQPLFETSIRVLFTANNSIRLRNQIKGMKSAFMAYQNNHQSIVPSKVLSLKFLVKARLFLFNHRLQNIFNTSNLSISEVSSIFHFPYTSSTKTEDLVSSYSKDLPMPLSLKNSTDLDVVFGKNTYGNKSIDIGLTDDDRSRHVYIIGQTGAGKSTIIYHMAKDDIAKGRGVAVIDPHGDLAEDLLSCVPDDRIDDCICLNPFDIGYPIGINLLELTPGLTGDELEQEKELVCEGVISVFRRIFSNDEKTNAHRIEYILRNAIYTAFYIPESTIFTVYELLNNPKYQRKITRALTDENLKNFWKNEFGKAGSFQVVKMVSGVTAKIGRFLFSPSAKRILEQSKSTINFDEILASGKILICNMAEGKLGEDTSQLLGTTIITKLQQSAMRRSRSSSNSRKPYYIFVDEFQNFATSSFTKLLSGGRKFGLRMTIAQQTTAQQEDRNVVNVILANTGTVVCFRTASPIDEQLMADQFTPFINKGDINNLPRYHFYIRLAAVKPEAPFSGKTLPIALSQNQKQFDAIITASRKNYAVKYAKSINNTNNNTSNTTVKDNQLNSTKQARNTTQKPKKYTNMTSRIDDIRSLI